MYEFDNFIVMRSIWQCNDSLELFWNSVKIPKNRTVSGPPPRARNLYF